MEETPPDMVHLTRPSIFIRDKPILWSQRMLHEDYDRKGSVEILSGRESQGARRQEEMIGGNLPVEKRNSDSDFDSDCCN
jgi:hypothetical protein